ncbi:MAG: hypothetical protein HRT43_11415 [Campylobacteraceae bacterium]|nr:hypothetical protein [Campylobacteraceae bacterium]
MKRLSKYLIKPRHRLCIFKNDDKKIYYMGSENRYERTTRYKINLVNMNLLIENTKFDDKCRDSSLTAIFFDQKILKCMGKLQHNAR